MSHLPPNKGTKFLTAAVVMAILGSTSAFAIHVRVDPSIEDDLSGARRTTKGDFIHNDWTRKVELTDLWATSEAAIGKDEGTTTEKLYTALKDLNLSTDKEIIVAVIDSGVDITHEDLQGKIWENPGEIGTDSEGKDKRTNGKDDDNDGFIDDVNGWNFIGAVKDGKPVNSQFNTLERSREYSRLKKLVEAGTLAVTDPYYVAVKKNYEDTLGDFPAECSRLDFQASDLIGDDADQLQAVCASDSMKGAKNCVTTSYGNNDVAGRGPDGKVFDKHGTHVAGIIAAIRDNKGADGKNIGIQGQATNVKIMSIRAVPGCDERDKDVANAIRFAADHGAKVVNMSFGKNFSPNKNWVDEATRYAESKGVLLVHAAGNESSSNEGSRTPTETRLGNYPNQFHFDSKGKLINIAANWVEVGASSRKATASLPAYFSNYGKTAIDLFAPGYGIMATVPNNGYQSLSGTSMASPETAGVAALLMSIFADADYAAVRKAMVETTSQYPTLAINHPSAGQGVLFSSLSVSGGIVNAYNAAIALNEAKKAREKQQREAQAAPPAAAPKNADSTSGVTAKVKAKAKKQPRVSTVQSAEARKKAKKKA